MLRIEITIDQAWLKVNKRSDKQLQFMWVTSKKEEKLKANYWLDIEKSNDLHLVISHLNLD